MLDEARRALSKSQGSVVLVGGEAGIGKSRLLAQFLRRAGDGRVRNLASAECLERAQQPFGPIREFVNDLVPNAPTAELTPVVLAALAQVAPDALSAANAVPRAAGFEKAELFAALATFFKLVAAKRATILTIEDLHWADASTLEFLTYLAPRVAGTRLLLIATYRSDEVEANEELRTAIARMVREPTVRRLGLGAFGAADVHSLIAAALDGHGTLPQQTVRDVEARCEGNPFFAEELLKSAVEHGGARHDPALPLSIRASILERLSSLSEDEARIVARAAVLGYRFDPNVLALTMGCEVDAVLPALRRARSLNIVTEESSDRIRFRFRHALTRQTIYDDMLQFDARRLHEQILHTLESQGEPERHFEELAYHAWAARDGAKTLLYNERAGEAALEMRAISEARACFERALSVAHDTGEEARILARLAFTAMLQGRTPEALESYEAALALRLDRTEYDAAAELVRSIVTERNNMADLTALDLGRTFLSEHGAQLSTEPRDMLLALMARVACGVYDFPAVREFLEQVSDPLALPARARQNYLLSLAETHAYAGEEAGFNATARAVYDLCGELPPYLALIVLYTVAQAGAYLGANDLVERALTRAARLETQWDFSGVAAFGAAAGAWYWYLRGRLDLANAGVERALQRGDLPVVFNTVATVAPLVALALDDEALATRTLDEDRLRISREQSSSPDDASILGARAAWMSEHGRLAEARSELRLAVAAMPRAVPACGIALALAARHLSAPELTRVQALVDPANFVAEDRAGRACAALVSAVLAERRDDAARAIALATAAADGFRSLGWPLYEARALEVAGRPGEARTLYQNCGAVADVRRLAQRPDDPAAGAEQALSTREREVAHLITRGLTNVAIAERLGVSWKTVEKHVSSIFAKLGVRSRAQVAALFVRNRIEEENETPMEMPR
jgi:DNA-binding NarL/FixJ family response regulator